jgi:hypothetical protein
VDLLRVDGRAGPGRGGQQPACGWLVEVDIPVRRGEAGYAEPADRERAGLVEADDVDAAERLERSGRSNQHAVPGQATRGRRLRDGGDQRQAFRHRGDRDRHTGRDRLA